jgi:L-histidine N-alpha-methyltransferase
MVGGQEDLAKNRVALGVRDRAKDVLEAAYNDAQGVTAEFNKNILTVMNRELRPPWVVLTR